MNKRILLFVGLLAVASMLTASLYSGVEKKEPIVKPAIEYTAHSVAIDGKVTAVDFAYAEILTPGFVSNFNRLVVFPETGSSAIAKAPVAATRGPPKKYRCLQLNV